MIGFQTFQQKSRTYGFRRNDPSRMTTLLTNACDRGGQIAILLCNGDLQRFNHYVERILSIDSSGAVASHGFEKIHGFGVAATLNQRDCGDLWGRGRRAVAASKDRLNACIKLFTIYVRHDTNQKPYDGN